MSIDDIALAEKCKHPTLLHYRGTEWPVCCLCNAEIVPDQNYHETILGNKTIYVKKLYPKPKAERTNPV